MTTDTIDALWKTVEKYPCRRASDAVDRLAQRAVLERLIDAYLDAGDDERAEAVRLILSKPMTCFFDLNFHHPKRWSLQAEVDVLDYCSDFSAAPDTPRKLFETLVPRAAELLRAAREQ